MKPVMPQAIIEMINEMINDRKGLEGPYHLGAIEALRELQIKIINR